MDKIRTCIVDDHAAVRSGLMAMLAGDAGIDVVADTGDSGLIVQMCGEMRPDVLLLDLGLSGGSSGLDFIAEIIIQCPHISIVIMTGSYRAQHVDQAITLGVKGYLTHASLETSILSESIRAVHSGRLYLDRVATAALFASRRSDEKIKLIGLTIREKEVLGLLGLGLSNKEIAERLGVAEKTARNHLSNSYTKLGLNSRLEAAAFARDDLA